MQYSVVFFLCILVILIVIFLVSIKVANQQLSSLSDINYKTGVCFFFPNIWIHGIRKQQKLDAMVEVLCDEEEICTLSVVTNMNSWIYVALRLYTSELREI